MDAKTLLSKYKTGERDFSGADLRRADLRRADLSGANLGGANLGGACLYGADLEGACLEGACLRRAYLRGVSLRGASLRGASLPSPPEVLLAHWGSVSDALCLALMRYDASNHPRPESFEKWVKTGICPYDGVKVERAANFCEDRKLWRPGPAQSAYELMVRVIREKCKDSDYHDKG